MSLTTAIMNAIATLGGLGLIAFLCWAAYDGTGDREAEDAAREYFTEHGHWPDEAPPAPSAR